MSNGELDDGEDEGWKKVEKRRKAGKERQWRRREDVDICNVEEGTEKGGLSTIKVDFQVAAVKNLCYR